MGNLDDRAAGRRLSNPWNGRVLVQGEVRTPLVIKGQETSERSSKRPLIPHGDVIETLPPQGSNQALDERILPRSAGRDHDLLDANTLQQATEVGSVAAVSIPDQIPRGGLVRKGFADLLPRPRGGRMVGSDRVTGRQG